MAKAVAGVDTIFHEAALASVPASVENPLASHAACATGNGLRTRRRAESRRPSRGVRRQFERLRQPADERETRNGSSFADLSLRGREMAGEIYCQAFAATYGIETVGLRYFNVFGPRQDPGQSVLSRYPALYHGPVVGMPAGAIRRWSSIARLRLRGECRARKLAGGRRPERQRPNHQHGRRPRATTLLTLLELLNKYLGHQRATGLGNRPASATSARAWPTLRWLARSWAMSPRSISKKACDDRIDYYKTIVKKA